jgi:hypothetical protein
MKALETSCRLRPGALLELGLSRVQDVLAHTEAAFIARFAPALGPTAARTVHRTAHVAEQQLITLNQRAGTPEYGSVFDAKSPTWISQFPATTTVVAPGSLGDSSSPASYATSLYALALQLESVAPADRSRITLATRRPDLAQTLLSEVTVNRAVAKLDIVNTTLQSGLENTTNNQALVKVLRQQGVLPAGITQLPCDTLLARLHYPGQALPYHAPHDQITSALAAQNTSLAGLTKQVQTEMPAFGCAACDVAVLNRVLQQSALLSPALLSLVVQPAISTLSTAQQQAFFAYNFGVDTTDSLSELTTFLAATHLSMDDAMALLCAAGVGTWNTSVLASANVLQLLPVPYNYGAVFIHGGKEPSLAVQQNQPGGPISITGLGTDGDRYDRINRQVRLQRQTGLPFDQLDSLLMAAIRAEGADNPDLTLNSHTVRALGFYQQWHAAYGLSAEDLAACLHEVAVYAVGTAVSQFDRLFNPRGNGGQPALVIDNLTFTYSANDGTDAVTVRQLCTGLKVSEAEFLQLAEAVNSALQLAPNQLARSVPVVSALFRLSRIAALLQLRVAELFALLQMMPRGAELLAQLAGVPQLARLDANGQPEHIDVLDDLQALADMVAWLQTQKLAVTDLLLLLAPPPDVLPASALEVALVNDINQHLSNARLDASTVQQSGLPQTDLNQASLDWFTLLTGKACGVLDPYGLISNEDAATRNQALQTLVNGLKLSDSDKASSLIRLQTLLDAALRSQQTLVDTQFGKVLAVAHGTVAALLPCLELSSYTLLNTCQALNTPGLTPAEIPQSLLQALNGLGRYSLVVRHFGLTPATLTAMTALPGAFGNNLCLNLNLLPLLADYAAWRQAAGSEDRVLQYVRDANATPPLSATQASARLADMLGADANQVQQAVDLLSHSDAGEGLAHSVWQIGHLMRLLNCAAQTGLSINLLQQMTQLDIGESVLKEKATDDDSFADWRVAGLALMATLALPQCGQF